ncbi:MAG TPA: hypothetical protein VKQ06_03795 [Gammaproteobacteria bacterium]|nr:hypothetical protein [Gammaproteobacteria bacterium]
MEILRYGRDVYGRETLEGASWDLIPVFAVIGALIIVAHLLYRWLLAPAGR